MSAEKVNLIKELNGMEISEESMDRLADFILARERALIEEHDKQVTALSLSVKTKTEQLEKAIFLITQWQGIWCKNQGRLDDVKSDTEKFLQEVEK